ncbi:MAG: GDSL-type esterase/lipase family protein [Acidobacteriota bacterium]
MAIRLSRFWLWTAPLLTGLAAAVLFGVGFVLALRGSIGEPIGDPPPPPEQPATARPPRNGSLRILVVGDSLAKGTGDETGKGFAVGVLEAFRKAGSAAQITNIGVNGMESPEVRALVDTPNVRALAAGASLILVSAGANDLSHGVTRGSDSTAEIADAVAAARGRYVENLRRILETLREANPTATICVLGLYDPFGQQTGPGRIGASVIVQWNTLLQETALAFPNVYVVPTFDLFYGRPDRLAADRYHPNAKAYAEIAARVMQVAGSRPLR